MTVSLIILSALIGVGLLLYLLDKKGGKRESGNESKQDAPQAGESSGESTPENSDDAPEPEVCCGMHLTCEKDSLLADLSEKVEYFDDEELDRFAGRGSESYTPEETEEFRDVLMTLLPADIAPWARSIQLRGITLPSPVREELLFLVAENRKN